MKKMTYLVVLLSACLLVFWGCDDYTNLDEGVLITVDDKYLQTVTTKMAETVTFKNKGVQEGGDITWRVKYDGETEFEDFACGREKNTVDLKFMRPGTHEIKCSIQHLSDSVMVTVIGNNYPIILVGGWLNWQRNESRMVGPLGNTLGVIYNWGLQAGDLEHKLNELGFDVYYAHTGPFDSAWDRACEIYASLTGGTYVKANTDRDDINYVKKDGFYVDYGAAHAKIFSEIGAKHGYEKHPLHRRFANPQLARPLVNSQGEKFTDKYNFPEDPVHIIGHSHGGLSARVFMGLMKYGSPNGDEGCGDYPASGLFATQGAPNKNFVRSLTTLATPHNGTTITYWAYDTFSFFDSLTMGLIDISWWYFTGGVFADIIQPVFDVDLRQFNVSLDDDFTEIEPVACWDETNRCGYQDEEGLLKPEYRPIFEDYSLWDLSPCGAKELNVKYPISGFKDETYFLSYNCEQSFRSSKNGCWYGEGGALERMKSWVDDETYDNGFISPVFDMLGNIMGSDEMTCGMAMTPRSVSRLQGENPSEDNYVPENVYETLTRVIDNVNIPVLLDVLNDYLTRNDFSRGWKFKNEGELREKLKSVLEEDDYNNYADTIIKHTAYQIGLNDNWKEFDGVVNTFGSVAPFGDEFVDGTEFKGGDMKKPVPNPDLEPQTGKWLYLDKLNNDHYDIIGSIDMISVPPKIRGEKTESIGVREFYEKHATRLWQLPSF